MRRDLILRGTERPPGRGMVKAVAVTAGFWLGRLTVSVWLFNLGSTKNASGATPVFWTWTSKAVDVKAGTASRRGVRQVTADAHLVEGDRPSEWNPRARLPPQGSIQFRTSSH